MSPGFSQPDDAPPLPDEVSELEPKQRRKVTYNQSAILCSFCQKRIRLNNNGMARVHVIGKAGSGTCPGSNAYPFSEALGLTPLIVDNTVDPNAKVTSDVFQKEAPEPATFSDIA